MKKASLAVLLCLCASAGAAYAQTINDAGVTMSTDPARAAEIEQRAQALRDQQTARESMPMHQGTRSGAQRHRAMHHRHTGRASGGK